MHRAPIGSAVRWLGIAVSCTALAFGGCSSNGRGTPAVSTGAAQGDGNPPSSAGGSNARACNAGKAVPNRYETLYMGLCANLDAYQAAVDAMPDLSGGRSPTPAAELLPANGNRLKDLLSPATMPAVDAFLDRFRSMGIRGITLGVKVPLLLPRFGPDAAAYTNFFATVADHARARGMTVDAELGALFCGTVYARCSKPFDGTYEQFVADTAAQARIVIDRLKPDYLTILSEPTTEATLVGIPSMKTPDGAARYVHDVLSGIGSRRSTKVGAGAAPWLPSTYVEAILREQIDYLTVHIYPVSASIAATIVQDTNLARAAGKPVMADEVGLYKTLTADSTAATAEQVYRLDNFAFFEPLDVRFLTITAQWAKKAGALYVSPFWAGQFFAYLDWTPQLDSVDYPTLVRTANRAVSQAFAGGHLTALGRAWPAVLTG